MAEGQQEGGPKKITVNVKTPKEKQSVEIEENATIKEVSVPTTMASARGLVLPCPLRPVPAFGGARAALSLSLCLSRSFSLGAPPGISCQTRLG